MNPTKREVLIQPGEPGRLRVELRRGGRIFAVRIYPWSQLGEALKLGESWILLGPAVLALAA